MVFDLEEIAGSPFPALVCVSMSSEEPVSLDGVAEDFNFFVGLCTSSVGEIDLRFRNFSGDAGSSIPGVVGVEFSIFPSPRGAGSTGSRPETSLISDECLESLMVC